jgi:Caspase domain
MNSIAKLRRNALIIGVKYASRRGLHLSNSITDAEGVARRLSKHKYVLVGGDTSRDPSTAKMRDDLTMLHQSCVDADGGACIFYFAGHGRESSRSGDYALLGNDSRKSQGKGITLREVIDKLARLNCLKIVVVDACRNHDEDATQQTESAPTSRLIRDQVRSTSDFVVLLSTRSGDVAADDDDSGRSPFLAALDSGVSQVAEGQLVVDFFSAIADTEMLVGKSRLVQKPEAFFSGSWSRRWTMEDIMASSSQPSNLLRLLHEDKGAVSQVLARFGTLRKGATGFSALVLLNDRKLHTADFGALDVNDKLKHGYDFVLHPRLHDIYEAALHYRSTVQAPIGLLRSVILSFEKAVVTAYPITGSKGILVGVTYPKDDYDYRDTRSTRDEIGERMESEESLTRDALTRDEKQVCSAVDYFAQTPEKDHLDFVSLLNTPGGDERKKLRLRRVFDLPQYNDGFDSGTGHYLMLACVRNDEEMDVDLFEGASVLLKGEGRVLKEDYKYVASSEMAKLYVTVCNAKHRLLQHGDPPKTDSHHFFGDLRSAAFSFDQGVVWAHPVRNDLVDPPREFMLISVTGAGGFDYRRGRSTIRQLLKDF